jgi:hypothetical protein
MEKPAPEKPAANCCRRKRRRGCEGRTRRKGAVSSTGVAESSAAPRPPITVNSRSNLKSVSKLLLFLQKFLFVFLFQYSGYNLKKVVQRIFFFKLVSRFLGYAEFFFNNLKSINHPLLFAISKG